MSAELEDIHEECGIFGVWGHPGRPPDSPTSACTRCSIVVQEGAGIVSNDNGHLIGHRGTGLLTQVFGDEREIERLKGDKAIGHVRYATAGSGGTDKHPAILFRFHDGDMALCHNGQSDELPDSEASVGRRRRNLPLQFRHRSVDAPVAPLHTAYVHGQAQGSAQHRAWRFRLPDHDPKTP